MIFKAYKSVATTRQQMPRLFSALYTHKNIFEMDLQLNNSF